MCGKSNTLISEAECQKKNFIELQKSCVSQRTNQRAGGPLAGFRRERQYKALVRTLGNQNRVQLKRVARHGEERSPQGGKGVNQKLDNWGRKGRREST